jgi:general secretion pathway protein G
MTRFKRPFIGLILAAVVAALAFVLYPQRPEAGVAAQEAVLKSQLFTMRDAIDEYISRTGKCPDSLSTLAQDKYVRSVPVDPFMKSAATWQYTQVRTGTRLNCDVHSTSTRVARDGKSRYADW